MSSNFKKILKTWNYFIRATILEKMMRKITLQLDPLTLFCSCCCCVCLCVCVCVCVWVCEWVHAFYMHAYYCMFVCVKAGGFGAFIYIYICACVYACWSEHKNIQWLYIICSLTLALTVVRQQAAPEPPAPVVKGPVPQEHKVLQDTFDGLLNACSQRATNAVSHSFFFSVFDDRLNACSQLLMPWVFGVFFVFLFFSSFLTTSSVTEQAADGVLGGGFVFRFWQPPQWLSRLLMVCLGSWVLFFVFDNLLNDWAGC